MFNIEGDKKGNPLQNYINEKMLEGAYRGLGKLVLPKLIKEGGKFIMEPYFDEKKKLWELRISKVLIDKNGNHSPPFCVFAVDQKGKARKMKLDLNKMLKDIQKQIPEKTNGSAKEIEAIEI
jgi:hypothetical protein